MAPADAKPALKLRMRVTIGDVIAVGPGKIDLLEALDETGSITAAAKSLDMSYRRAWLLIDELNRSLKEPAVATAAGGAKGGGSVLTDTGRSLIALYREIEATAQEACKPEIRQLMKLLVVS
ncbi:winged helix-turn-helix domain-containing protein [Roseateles sp. So40a]|uniref:winged helix-turn-helix domain-containing protein n=1 Tax=Roseateles sp. So40a TaxID=3400226 RepID=UPI003A852C2B